MAANNDLNLNTNFSSLLSRLFSTKMSRYDLQVSIAKSTTLFSHFWQRVESTRQSASYHRVSKIVGWKNTHTQSPENEESRCHVAILADKKH